MLQGLRCALRTLRKSPGFTAVSVIVIALGIAANTAVFSIVNGVLLRPLPYRSADRLVLVRERIPKFLKQYLSFSAPDVVDLERSNRTFDSVAGFNPVQMNISSGAAPVRATGVRVSASLFPMLGINPALGRTFTREEDRPGIGVIVLSYGLWQDHFGADGAVLGSNISLNGQPYTVIGVMPREFMFPPRGTPGTGGEQFQRADFWIPMAFTREELSNVVDNFDIGVVARLKPGIGLAQAQADVNSVARQIQAKYSFAYKDGLTLEMGVLPMDDAVVGASRTTLLLLLGAVGFVLLIACANVANLLLTRTAGRQREMAIRSAIGASRARIVRQLLTESTVVAVFGGIAGTALAWAGMDVFVAILPGTITHSLDIRIDFAVLAFAIGLTFLTGLLFGTIPAIAVVRGNLVESLNETGRGSTAGARRRRLKNVLAVSEVALSLVLLTGAGLLIRSYDTALRTDPGFSPDHVLSFTVNLPETQYSSADQVRSFYRELSARLGALPGVREVANGSWIPLTGTNWDRTFIPEGWSMSSRKQIPLADYTLIDGPYFQALGIPLLRGRYLNATDQSVSRPVCVVNEELARRYWPGADPIGKTLKMGGPDSTAPPITIAGVVRDARVSRVEDPPQPHVYQVVIQQEARAMRANSVVLRAQGDPAALASAVRSTVASLDRSLPVAELRTMNEVLNSTFEPRRFNAILLGVFAALALFLAVIGIHGVIAYSVTQRTQEIGIRMALGANRSDVLRIVLREGLAIAGVGIALGAAASLALTRYLASLLYGVKPNDPATLIAVAVVLAAAAIGSAWLPARRAMNVETLEALRRD